MAVINRKNRIKSIYAWIAGWLCAVMLFCVPAEAAASALDYGRNAAGDTEMSASELFDALFGESEPVLSTAEREALDALSDVILRYNRIIPASGVIGHTYDGDTGVFTATVKSHNYVAANGKSVSWIPVTVSMDDGDAKPLTKTGDDIYTYSYTDMWHSDEVRLTVDFVWHVEIPVEVADELLTLPYTVGSSALAEMTQYEGENTEYLARVQAYSNYLQARSKYDFAVSEYERYDAETAVYLQKCEAYAAYRQQLEQYGTLNHQYLENEKKKAAYEELERKYFAYQTFLAQNATLLAQYDRYTNDMAAVNARLCIMESMFLYDSHSWQFYSGVMGGTVDQVLAHRKELADSGLADVKDLDKADRATTALRPLLKGYSDIRSAKYENALERTRAEFAYYSEHYEEIRTQVTALYEALYGIYHANSVLQGVMNEKYPDKIEHFRQFMGQLYVLRCALNGQKPQDSWSLSKYAEYPVSKLVEEKLLLTDAVALPGNVKVPEKEVVLKEEDIPEQVESLPEKDYDPDMKEPEKPAPVEQPPKQAPVKPTVERPAAAPDEVPEPGPEPVKPVLSVQALALAEELRAGKLTERPARGCAQTLELHRSVSAGIRFDNLKRVIFRDHNDNIIWEELVEYGRSPSREALSLKPVREKDNQNEYTFLGWVRNVEDSVSSFADLYEVKEDITLYPRYKTTPRTYAVTWDVNGIRQVQWLKWGELPVCTLSTERQGTADRTYTFSGWSPEVVPVAGDAVYTALYTVSLRMFEITWELGDRTLHSNVAYGEIPVCPVNPADRTADRYSYVFTGWNREPKAATQNATYTAKYQSTALAVADNSTVCGVTHGVGAITLHAEYPTVNFSAASAYARAKGTNLVLQWGCFSVTLDDKAMKALESAYCVKLEWKQEPGETEEAVYFRLRALNSIGQDVSYSSAFKIRLNYVPMNGMYAAIYSVNGNKHTEITVTRFTGGIAEFQIRSGAQMLWQPEYDLQITEPTGNCNLTALPKRAPSGVEIALNPGCTYGYEVVSATVTYADGRISVLEKVPLIMPKQAVSVELKVERIVYHIRFVVDGNVISEQEVFFGEEILIPADPFKPEDDEHTYAFAGWSPYVTKATGEDRSPVYTALFTRESKASGILPGQDVDRFLSRVLPVVLLVLVLIVAVIVLCIRFRRQIGRQFVRLCRYVVAVRKQKKSAAVPAIPAKQLSVEETESLPEGSAAESPESGESSDETDESLPETDAPEPPDTQEPESALPDRNKENDGEEPR